MFIAVLLMVTTMAWQGQASPMLRVWSQSSASRPNRNDAAKYESPINQHGSGRAQEHLHHRWWEPMSDTFDESDEHGSPKKYKSHSERGSNEGDTPVGRFGHSMATYKLFDAGKLREFIIVTGGYGEWDVDETFPVWAYEISQRDGRENSTRASRAEAGEPPRSQEDSDRKWNSRWIDLSGKNFGNGAVSDFPFWDDVEFPPPRSPLWPQGRVGHLSHVTADGMLHVWGGSIVKGERLGNFGWGTFEADVECDEVPYVWRTQLNEDLLLRRTTPESVPPLLIWERIIPKVVLYGANASDLAPGECVLSSHNSSTAQDLQRFWGINQLQWNSTLKPSGTKYSVKPELAVASMQRLRRTHAKGGPWVHKVSPSAHETGFDSFVMYGGLYRITVDVHHPNQNPLQAVITGKPENPSKITAFYEVLGDVWSFHFDSCTFRQLSLFPPPKNLQRGEEGSFPPKRSGHGAVVVDNTRLVIHGGWTSQSASVYGRRHALSDIWSFDLQQQEWKEIETTESAPQRDHTIVALKSADNATTAPKTVLATFGGCFGGIISTIQRGLQQCEAGSSATTFVPMNEDGDVDFWSLPPSRHTNDVEGGSIAPGKRSDHGAVLDDSGRVFVWGGFPGSSLDSFDATMWRMEAPKPWSSYGLIKQKTVRTSKTHTRSHEHVDLAEPAAEGNTLFIWFMFAVVGVVFLAVLTKFFARVVGGGEARQPHVQPCLGLSTEEIDSLPLRTHRRTTTSPPEQTEHGACGDEECCAICLFEYADGDYIRCLPCQHEFHQGCIDSWLAHHATCPSCRQALRKHSVPESDQPDSRESSRSRGVLVAPAWQRLWFSLRRHPVRVAEGNGPATRLAPSTDSGQPSESNDETHRGNESAAGRAIHAVASDGPSEESLASGVATTPRMHRSGGQGRSMMHRLRTSLRQGIDSSQGRSRASDLTEAVSRETGEASDDVTEGMGYELATLT